MLTQKKPADNTALQRQKRHIEKLKRQGVTRSTVFVHNDCRAALDELRPLLLDPTRAEPLSALISQHELDEKPTNVAQVNQLSPFRYPGGKTWLIPEIRKWLQALKIVPHVFVEPFAGGAMAGLTAAAEGLAETVVLSELDNDVACVWQTIFDGADEELNMLCRRISDFVVTLPNVLEVLHKDNRSKAEMAFRTIIKNRMQRGGIMASGAGLVKSGESGRGLMSRWYPETLVSRIRILRALRSQISFHHMDAFDLIDQFVDNSHACFFVDPPYTVGGKKAGKRLYAHNEVNHDALFALLAKARGPAMFTYDDAPEVRELAARYLFRTQKVPMKNTHHQVMHELIILKS